MHAHVDVVPTGDNQETIKTRDDKMHGVHVHTILQQVGELSVQVRPSEKIAERSCARKRKGVYTNSSLSIHGCIQECTLCRGKSNKCNDFSLESIILKQIGRQP